MKLYFVYLSCLIMPFLTGGPDFSRKHELMDTDTVLVKLNDKKVKINLILKGKQKDLLTLVKVPGKRDLVQVKNEQWPDDVAYTYNVLKDAAGKIVFIEEMPFSESGDWDIVYKHYFDENTFAFEKIESIFNDEIKGGVIREKLIKYYDVKFTVINQAVFFTDKDGRIIKANKNGYDFPEYKYVIYRSLKAPLTAYHINIVQ